MKYVIGIALIVAMFGLFAFIYFGRWPSDLNDIKPGMDKSDSKKLLTKYGRLIDDNTCDAIIFRRGFIDGYAENEVVVTYYSNNKVANVEFRRSNIFSMYKWIPKIFSYTMKMRLGE